MLSQFMVTRVFFCNAVSAISLASSWKTFLRASAWQMAHWSVDDLLKEIKDLESLHALRPQSMVVSNLLKGLETKVQAMDCLTPSMLVKLTEALDASSLTDEMKQSLHDLVEARAMEANSGALRLQNQPQVLLSLYNYMSAQEWELLQQAPFTQAVQICVNRMRACGLKSMKESTKKHVLAMLIHLMLLRGEPQPPGTEIYKMSTYLLDSLKASKQQALVAGLAVYPDKPADIGSVP